MIACPRPRLHIERALRLSQHTRGIVTLLQVIIIFDSQGHGNEKSVTKTVVTTTKNIGFTSELDRGSWQFNVARCQIYLSSSRVEPPRIRTRHLTLHLVTSTPCVVFGCSSCAPNLRDGLSGGVISSLFMFKVRFNSSNLTLNCIVVEIKQRSLRSHLYPSLPCSTRIYLLIVIRYYLLIVIIFYFQL